MGSRQIVLVSTAGISVLNAGIFWREAKPKRLFSQCIQLGLATEFCSNKIPRNRLGMISVHPRKKLLIPRHSEVYGRVNGTEQNDTKKISFTKNPAPANRGDSMYSVFVRDMLQKGILSVCIYLSIFAVLHPYSIIIEPWLKSANFQKIIKIIAFYCRDLYQQIVRQN